MDNDGDRMTLWQRLTEWVDWRLNERAALLAENKHLHREPRSAFARLEFEAGMVDHYQKRCERLARVATAMRKHIRERKLRELQKVPTQTGGNYLLLNKLAWWEQ